MQIFEYLNKWWYIKSGAIFFCFKKYIEKTLGIEQTLSINKLNWCRS